MLTPLVDQFDGNNWVFAWSQNMHAQITQTTSFEFTTPDNQYRVVIKSRLADLHVKTTSVGEKEIAMPGTEPNI